jgi:hypothetical protein
MHVRDGAAKPYRRSAHPGGRRGRRPSRASSAKGRWRSFASGQGAQSHVAHSSGLVGITGIAFGCTAPTSAFGSVVRKAYRSSVVSPSFTFRTLCHPSTKMPAKQMRGRSSVRANHTGGCEPPGAFSFSLKWSERWLSRLHVTAVRPLPLRLAHRGGR